MYQVFTIIYNIKLIILTYQTILSSALQRLLKGILYVYMFIFSLYSQILIHEEKGGESFK
jgi:hypothetical protein